MSILLIHWVTSGYTTSGCVQGSWSVTSGFPDGLPDGTGSAWLNFTGYLTQRLGVDLTPNTLYSFSAYTGVRAGNGNKLHTYALQLLAGGQLLQEITGVIEEENHGKMKFISANFTSPGSVESNQELEIRLVLVDAGPQLAFDLVVLTASN